MDRDHQPARIALARHIRLLQARGVGHGPRVRSAVPRAAEPISNSEGGSAPLPVLPPKTSCAGEAGARNGTGLGGGLRPPSEPPPKNKLRRRSRRSERNRTRRGAPPPFRTSPQKQVAPAKPALGTEHQSVTADLE